MSPGGHGTEPQPSTPPDSYRNTHTHSFVHTPPPLYDPLCHTTQPNLYDIYAELRQRHPVYYCELRDVWCISRYASVLSVTRDWKTFSHADGVNLEVPAQFFGRGDFLDSDPPRHDQLRNLARGWFSPKGVQALGEHIDARVTALLDRLPAEGAVDLAASFAWQLPISVICSVLGIPQADLEQVRGWMLNVSARDQGVDEPPAIAVEALQELQDYIRATAELKRREPAGDLLTHLIGAVDDHEMTLAELVGMSVLLFMAGSETTASMLGNGLMLLHNHVSQQAAIREGAVPVAAAVEEILRYESPLQYDCRTTTREASLDGICIPENARVAVLYGSANRDSDRVEGADEFDVSRDPTRHLAFGNGIHFCLGAPLARLEGHIALTRFLERIKRYELTDEPVLLANHQMRSIINLPAVVARI